MLIEELKPAGSPTTTAPRTVAEIAASILGGVDWASPTMGYCECPGKKSHGAKDGAKDCIVYLDRVPTVHCVHASCKSSLDATNRRLRSAGKSLHGWFEYPDDEEVMNDLHLILPALKCDPKMLTPSQPARLPGAMRDEKRQRLIFLAKEEPNAVNPVK